MSREIVCDVGIVGPYMSLVGHMNAMHWNSAENQMR